MPELPDLVVLARSLEEAVRGETFADVESRSAEVPERRRVRAWPGDSGSERRQGLAAGEVAVTRPRSRLGARREPRDGRRGLRSRSGGAGQPGPRASRLSLLERPGSSGLTSGGLGRFISFRSAISPPTLSSGASGRSRYPRASPSSSSPESSGAGAVRSRSICSIRSIWPGSGTSTSRTRSGRRASTRSDRRRAQRCRGRAASLGDSPRPRRGCPLGWRAWREGRLREPWPLPRAPPGRVPDWQAVPGLRNRDRGAAGRLDDQLHLPSLSADRACRRRLSERGCGALPGSTDSRPMTPRERLGIVPARLSRSRVRRRAALPSPSRGLGGA